MIDDQTADNILKGLDAIMNRSSGLQSFTEAYRNLTKIPKPNFQSLDLGKALERIETLLKSDLDDIHFMVDVSGLKHDIIADPDLLDQVFINIIKNAMSAVKGKDSAQIIVSINQEEKTSIVISDNGMGIEADKLDQIFIPFFTTKKNGSGIGLALSKQIMMLHNGTIKVNSEHGEGTQFTLSL